MDRTRWLFGVLFVLGMLMPFQNFIYVVFAMTCCASRCSPAPSTCCSFSPPLVLRPRRLFGSAAYVTAYVCKEWGWPPEIGVLAGTALSAVLGWAFAASRSAARGFTSP